MAEGSTQPPHATRFLETTQGVLSYAQLAPLLAERVLRVQENIEDGIYSAKALDESLLCDLHRAICLDLTPEWAGCFRKIEVKVGNHQPPTPYHIPLLLKDYFADIKTRLATSDDTLLLEALAFAEGRLLSIHPFTDFNGRATRLFLAELLRRLDLPLLDLAPETPDLRDVYLRALRAADRLDWKPLSDVWKTRLETD